jgi:hypothetical protein
VRTPAIGAVVGGRGGSDLGRREGLEGQKEEFEIGVVIYGRDGRVFIGGGGSTSVVRNFTFCHSFL